MDFNEGQRQYKVQRRSAREGTLLQESTDESTKLATKLHVAITQDVAGEEQHILAS